MKGKQDESVQALSNAIDNGWREWWTQYDPLLENIRTHPKYKELIDFIEQDLARQRAEARLLFKEAAPKQGAE